jgi:putative peptidoglycan lipid II flippase
MNSVALPKKKRRVSIGNIAFLLISTSFIGQLLGFLRTKLVNANFPTVGPHSTDAYFAAFNVPDLFFFILAAGALGVSLMPVLSDRLHKGDKQAMWELSSSLMNLLAIVMGIVGIIILVFAQPLIKYIVAPGLGPAQLHNATVIMRLLAFNPLLFTISGVLTSIEQTMGRFFFYAIAPIFYNLSIILSIFIFRHNIGIVGLGIGACVGAIAQLLVIVAGLWKLGVRWHPRVTWKSTDLRHVLRNLPPRSFDLGLDQVESIVETHIASDLGSGNITYYSNAYILSTAPILLLGTGIATAAFPRLNARLSMGRPDLFRKDFLMVTRAMIWLSAPVVIICFFCRGYLARLIYSRGGPQIAALFGFLSLAIFFNILYMIISRWFYAQKDTKTPLFVSLIVIVLNVYLAVTLARPNPHGYGVDGLAMAQSIVAMVQVLLLTLIMIWRDPKLLNSYFWAGVGRIISVTGFTVVTAYIMISFYPLGARDRGIITLGTKLFFITATTFAVHVIVSNIFGLEEAGAIIRRLRKIILTPIRLDM